MRIGRLSGFGGVGAISGSYSVSSIHGNPRSLRPVDKISEKSQSAKPLAIVNKESEEEQKKIRGRQNMTASKDYEAVMQQMMNGKDPAQLFKANGGQEDAAQKAYGVASSVRDTVKSLTEDKEPADTAGSIDDVISNNSGVNAFQMQKALDAYHNAMGL